MSKPNARFWVWHNCWTKLTLRPGEKLAHSYGGRTDEGYYYGREEYEYDEERDVVVLTIVSDSRDCDGRLSEERIIECPIGELRSRDICAEKQDAADREDVGIFIPNWRRVSSRQRDEYAEAAGY